jgi:DNA-directed RNA polymerase specialized sigma24 family protein
MVRVEGYISKKNIVRWLEHYEYLQVGDQQPDALPMSTGGPKADDGISGGFLNRVMLDQAIDNLPPLMKACIKARYVHKLPLGKTLRVLGIGQGVYYERCKMAVDHIYKELNGDRLGVKALLEKIIK